MKQVMQLLMFCTYCSLILLASIGLLESNELMWLVIGYNKQIDMLNDYKSKHN